MQRIGSLIYIKIIISSQRYLNLNVQHETNNDCLVPKFINLWRMKVKQKLPKVLAHCAVKLSRTNMLPEAQRPKIEENIRVSIPKQ